MKYRSCVLALVASLVYVCPAKAQTLTATRDDYASRAGARGITSADFNRDGWLDFATANEGPNGVAVMLNRGEAGGFTTVFLPLAGGPFDLAAGDLNRDGVADLAVANADGNTIDILLGVASGGFAAPVSLAAPVNPRGITLADVDEDGRLDIVYTGWQANTAQILYGDGAGRFAARGPALTTCRNPQGVAAADFNLDGRPDLAVACNGGVGLTVFTQAAGGTFSRQDAPGYTSQNVLAVGDLNRDGRPDVAAVSTNGDQISIYINHPSGLASALTYSRPGSPRGIALADLNRDGLLDVAVASRGTSTLGIMFGNGGADGALGDTVELAAGAGSRAVTIGDFNHDSRLDLATGNEYASTVTALSNTTAFAQTGFAYHRSYLGTQSNTGRGDPTNVVMDVDRDGTLDVVTDHASGGFDALLGNGQQILSADGERALTSAHAIDLNGDAYPDLVAARYPPSGYDPYVIETFVNDGTGHFTKGTTFSSGMLSNGITPADVNRDGKEDLVIFGSDLYPNTATFIQIFLSDGHGGFTSGARMPAKDFPRDVIVQDVTRDGIPDLVVRYDRRCCSGGQSIDIFAGDGTGAFTARDPVVIPNWVEVFGLAVGDVNADGYADLVATGYAPSGEPYQYHYELTAALGSASGFVVGAGTPVEVGGYGIGEPTLADLDLDGRLDIMTNAGWFLQGQGDGTFGAPHAFDFTTYGPLAAADFNRDGIVDLEYIQYDDYPAILTNQRQSANTPPTVTSRQLTVNYDDQFGEDGLEISAEATDADLHRLSWEWRDAQGKVLSTEQYYELPTLPPGNHVYTVTVRDGRGGEASGTVTLTINPMPEMVLHVAKSYATTQGNWEIVQDATAAGGVRLHDKNLGAPKVTQPVANPSSFGVAEFVADPTQTYKLWFRLKADNNNWANDSVWIQISGAVDGAGNPIGAPGTSSGIEVNLEECSNCGVSGWGWRDEAWGSQGAIGSLTLRFPQGGWQSIKFQTREDGVSIDQFVLSAQKYRTTRPGTVKNDTTILAPTLGWQQY